MRRSAETSEPRAELGHPPWMILRSSDRAAVQAHENYDLRFKPFVKISRAGVP